MSTASTAIYVGDLDRSIGEKVLFDIFSKYGAVVSTRVCRDSMTRESLGYGYVNFASHDSAANAVESPHTEIAGKTCRVMWSIRDPTVRKSGANNVFVSNLPESLDSSQLVQDLFSAFGSITSAKLATSLDGKSLGYAYVDFETNESAKDAIAKLHEADLNGKVLRVTKFIPAAERRANVKWTNVFAKNVPLEWTDEQMRECFAKYGAITSLVVARDEEGKSKGFGFVNFAEHESAVAAAAGLNDQVLEGDENKKFYVARHQKKDERQRMKKIKSDADKADRNRRYMNMNLYVRNIHDTLTDDEFREAFSVYGKITSARIMRDATGGSRGFGFVCYTTPEEAQRAIQEMNGKLLGSKQLYVRMYEKKENRIVQPPMPFSYAFGYPPQGYMAAPMKAARYPPRQMQIAQQVRPMHPQMTAPMAMGMPQMQAVAPPQATSIADAKNHFGSIIYPIAFTHYQDLAGKLTGMLLELELHELSILANDPNMLLDKLMEAKNVLQSSAL